MSELNPGQQSLQSWLADTASFESACTLRCAPAGVSSEGLAENFVAIHQHRTSWHHQLMKAETQMKKLFLKTNINPEFTAKLFFLLIRFEIKTIWPSILLLCISNKQAFFYLGTITK